VAATAQEEVRFLQKQEERYKPTRDYLKTEGYLWLRSNEHMVSSDDEDSDSQRDYWVPKSWRIQITDWCYSVVDYYEFDREAVAIAMNYFDRYVSSLFIDSGADERPISKKNFQLLAIACLDLSLKLHGYSDTERVRRTLDTSILAQLSSGVFSVPDIQAMEHKLQEPLCHHLNPPTTLSFIRVLLLLMPPWPAAAISALGATSHDEEVVAAIFEMAKYLAEGTVCESAFTFQYKPSEVAFAALLDAIDALPQDVLALPNAVRAGFLEQVSDATSLSPNTDSIHRARACLRSSYPFMLLDRDEDEDYLFSQRSVTPEP
jgi:hypothetical protein